MKKILTALYDWLGQFVPFTAVSGTNFDSAISPTWFTVHDRTGKVISRSELALPTKLYVGDSLVITYRLYIGPGGAIQADAAPATLDFLTPLGQPA